MNPITGSTAPGRSEAGNGGSAVPSDIASLFAAIFAAVAAATGAPQPTPIAIPALPEGAENPAVTSDGVSPSRGWPAATLGGPTVATIASATGRSNAGRNALTGSFVDLAPVHPEPSELATGAAQAERAHADVAQSAAANGQPAPTTASALLAAAAGTLERMKLGEGAKQAKPASSSASGAEDTKGTPLSALSARAGANPGAGKPDATNADANAAQGGRGKGRANAGAADREGLAASADAAQAVPGGASAFPSLPPAAHGAGVTPRAPLIESPIPETGTAGAPVEVPDARAQTANPSHATVAFDSGDGQEGRLRVSLRGNTLRATIEMPDAAAAQRLEQDSASLARSLRAQGFDEARLVIDSPRAAGTTQRGNHDAPREHKHTREGQSHTGERDARRERGAPRNER